MTSNPFKVYSPEDMSAEQVTTLYVPVAEKLEIDGPDHVFLHGHRGCGKSMMLRSMAPDCQMIDRESNLRDLPYLGIYATIKATGLDVAEYERLKSQYVGIILAEHSLVAFLGSKIFESLREHCLDAIEKADGFEELKAFVLQKVLAKLQRAGAEVEKESEKAAAAQAFRFYSGRHLMHSIPSMESVRTFLTQPNASSSAFSFTPTSGCREVLD